MPTYWSSHGHEPSPHVASILVIDFCASAKPLHRGWNVTTATSATICLTCKQVNHKQTKVAWISWPDLIRLELPTIVKYSRLGLHALSVNGEYESVLPKIK